MAAVLAALDGPSSSGGEVWPALVAALGLAARQPLIPHALTLLARLAVVLQDAVPSDSTQLPVPAYVVAAAAKAAERLLQLEQARAPPHDVVSSAAALAGAVLVCSTAPLAQLFSGATTAAALEDAAWRATCLGIMPTGTTSDDGITTPPWRAIPLLFAALAHCAAAPRCIWCTPAWTAGITRAAVNIGNRLELLPADGATDSDTSSDDSESASAADVEAAAVLAAALSGASSHEGAVWRTAAYMLQLSRAVDAATRRDDGSDPVACGGECGGMPPLARLCTGEAVAAAVCATLQLHLPRASLLPLLLADAPCWRALILLADAAADADSGIDWGCVAAILAALSPPPAPSDRTVLATLTAHLRDAAARLPRPGVARHHAALRILAGDVALHLDS